MEKKRTISIAFEGLNRTGKGTQIELLKKRLQDVGIPCISIRGEGYRHGSGASSQDPKSDFWKRMSERLRTGEDFHLWEEASYRLARELVVWRDRVLSKEIDKILAPFGVLLVDRSLISKAILKSVESGSSPEKVFSSEELYPHMVQNHKKITASMVLPDIIFELVAPKEVLMSRLNAIDQGYEFKKNNIENAYELYIDAKRHLPQEIRDKIITIDSSAEPSEVYRKISEEIKTRFPELKALE